MKTDEEMETQDKWYIKDENSRNNCDDFIDKRLKGELKRTTTEKEES